MASYIPAGPQFRVNSARAGNQYINSATALDDGGFLLVWTSFLGGAPLVKAQRYDSAGLAVGTELLVTSAGTPSFTFTSTATGLEGGGFVIAWESPDTTKDGSGSAILARLYDSSGQAVGGEFVVNSDGAGNQSAVAMVGLAGGNFLASWTTSQPASGGTLSEVKGRLFDSAGVAIGAEFLLNTTTTGAQSQAAVAADSAGGFVAAWKSDSNSGDVYAQRFDSAGAKVGGEFLVNTITAGTQGNASVTFLADGRIAVVWLSTAPTGTPQVVKGQLFDSTGTAIGSEFTVTETGAPPQTSFPQVKALPNGGFVVTWAHVGNVSMGSWARLYDSSGVASAAFMVNSATSLFEDSARSLVTAGGDIVVAWTSSPDVTTTDVSARIIALNKAPAIQSDGGGASASVTVAEDQSVVTQVIATDLVGPAPVSYSIVGGADSALFAIDSTGHLTFLAAPDAQAPADSDLDNVYEVVVSASDGELSDTQALSVTVAATGRPLIIASSGQVSALENATVATRVSASDAAATFAITGGADAALFAIDQATGLLSFVAAPNFEAPSDSGADNVYDVEVTATAAGQSVAQALAVTVRNVNEGAALASTALTVNENSTTLVLTALDTEGDPVTYRVVGGADASKLYFYSAGVLTFSPAPNFEAPGDAGADGVYDVIVSISDGDIFTTQALTITVANVNEGVMISSNGAGATASITLQENQSAVTTVTSRDNPTGTSVTYSLVSGSDSSKFAINAQTGALTFVSGPNFEAPTDTNGDNVYQVTVRASDGTVTDTQALSVTVTNVNEPFAITSFGGGDTAQVNWSENSSAITVATNDPDLVNLSFSIIGGADASRFAFSWVNKKEGYFNFTTAPNFELPGDVSGDNVYEVIFQVSDGVHTDTQTVTFTIVNANEAPVITTNGGGASASLSIAENDTAVTSVAATDVDGPTTFTYSISGGADASKFSINSATGALRFVNAPNFEVKSDVGANNVYDVIVKASDGSLFDTQAIAVTVTNVNEAPVITSGGGGATASYSIAENAVFVAFASASDPEFTTASWSIVGGADAAKFTINFGGAINLVPAANFESPTDAGGNNVYDVIIQASDGVFTDTQAIAVTVTNVNEAPVITSDGGGATGALIVGENGQAVTTVASTDPENTARTYSISGGADSAKFAINSATGALTFVAAPNFEAPTDAGANNVYDVIVKASDGTLFDTQALAITVANVNEAPVITSGGGGATGTVQLAENGSAVTTVQSSDVDGPAASYSIDGGADSALFAIDPVTGALSFLSAPDREAPADVGADNVYEVVVKASDGTLSDTQALAVTVSNVNEAPVVTSDGGGASGSVQLLENGTAVTTVQSSDVDGPAATYAIAGGADAALFSIDPVTGALSFLAAPDYEAPADFDADNVYEVTVSASDGSLFDSQDLSISVGDLFEEGGEALFVEPMPRGYYLPSPALPENFG